MPNSNRWLRKLVTLAASTFLIANEPHWSFRKITRPTPPRVRQSEWPRNGSDSFVLARLEKENVAPSPEADRVTLIRRVTLDLIGLPPTPEEVEEFVKAESPDAYERLVDRLLASPQYGERWARPWLDLCHYGDSDGHLTDQLRPVAWRYRDWVTRMLNDNLPFDEFTVRQIAGDLLDSETASERVTRSVSEGERLKDITTRQKIAATPSLTLQVTLGGTAPNSLDRILGTGFLRQTLSNREGGADLEEYRVAQIVDRTSMVGTIWLGLTVGCARCHDHKYDPVTQEEFFRLYAFFDDADEVNIDAPLPDEVAGYQRSRPEYERRRREIVKPYRAGLTELQKQWEAKALHAAAHPGEDHVWDRQWEVLGLIWGGQLGEGQLEGCEIVRRPWEQRTPRQQDDWLDYFLQHGSIVHAKKFADLKLPELQKQLAELKIEFAAAHATRAPVMQAAFTPRQTYIHERGDFRSRGADVAPGFPACARRGSPDPAASTVRRSPKSEDASGPTPVRGQETRAQRAERGTQFEPPRLALARWLVSPDNPLTARVTVNRLWQEFFGRGIVATSDDFGTRGDSPSHPELLDWLAAEFMRVESRESRVESENKLHSSQFSTRNSGLAWDIKRMHRLIVTSATYRQSSRPREELATRDPNNVLLARQNSLRVPAETVRDEALAVSGLLSRKLGGPSVFPPQHERVTMEAFGSNSWKTSEGFDRYRRGLYTFILRTSPFAQAITFDAPPPVDVCTRRDRSNTPLQALTLLNDPVFGEMSAAFADRIQHEAGESDEDRIRHAVRQCLSRSPTEAEMVRLKQYLDDHDPQTETVRWRNLAGVLLNLHEFITRD
jgi:uncharacterized protein DUF1553/uncharacterized protein DUF1549